MIIITDNTDVFSNRVKVWLKSKGENCIRLNTEEPIDHFYFELLNGDCSVWLSRKADKSEFPVIESTVWHRRGRLSFEIPFKPGEIDPQVYLFLRDESISLSNAVLMILDERGLLIGRHIIEKGNKLFNLYLASKCGFKIPKTFITNRKEKLLSIYLETPTLITKPISDNFFGKMDGKNLIGFVNDFDESVFELLPDTFYPTLFQEKIEREFEVRSFLFCGDIFSMATFVSKEDASNSDIKSVEKSKKRYVPYKLTADITAKLLNMATKLDIDTASFDFIVDANGDTFFLELNQFGLLNEMSYSCNYSVEEFVANKLMNHGR